MGIETASIASDDSSILCSCTLAIWVLKPDAIEITYGVKGSCTLAIWALKRRTRNILPSLTKFLYARYMGIETEKNVDVSW